MGRFTALNISRSLNISHNLYLDCPGDAVAGGPGGEQRGELLGAAGAVPLRVPPQRRPGRHRRRGPGAGKQWDFNKYFRVIIKYFLLRCSPG